MSSSTELQRPENIDAIPSVEKPSEVTDTRMYTDAYDRNSRYANSAKEGDRFNFASMANNFSLVEFNKQGGTDFDYRKEGGSSYDFRPYLSQVYGCGCGCDKGGGCSCWDRSMNFFNQNTDTNKMICGLDANGKYYGPEGWRQYLFGDRSGRGGFNQNGGFDSNQMICGLDAEGRYHGPASWRNRLFGPQGQRSAVCGPDGCYPMDQSRNYYNGRLSEGNAGGDQSGLYYGGRRGMQRYNFNNREGEPGSDGQSSGGCSSGSCGGGSNRGFARNLISKFLGLFRRH
jgi:hypothetical protein